MFAANFNVFIALLTLAIYMVAWLSGISVSMLVIPYDGSLIIFNIVILSFGFILVFIWARMGLVRSTNVSRYKNIHKTGHWIIVIANIVLIGGIGFFLRVASHSKEDEYWFGLIMTSVIAPVGSIMASIGLVMVLLIPLSRHPQK